MTVIRPTRALLAAFLIPSLWLGCRREVIGPESNYTIQTQAGGNQIGAIGTVLDEPLQALVRDAKSAQVVPGVAVQWSIVQGAGATLVAPSSSSDPSGFASTFVRLGPDTGTYVIEAAVQNAASPPARFEVRAVIPPHIDAVTPTEIAAGDTVTIEGANFSTQLADNTVLFGGFRGTVASATATLIRAVVPACVPTNIVPVVVRLGGAASNTVAVAATGEVGVVLELERGQVRTFATAEELECVRLPGIAGAEYLVVPHNAATAAFAPMRFFLAGMTGAEPVATPTELDDWWSPKYDAATAFERWLRLRERQIDDEAVIRPGETPGFPLAQVVQTPQVGQQQAFSVITAQQNFTSITAEVKAVGTHAIIYQDLTAPSGGFSAADFNYFAALFDDPIHPTNVAIFGQPSDIDGNGRVVILFTPVVNEWTPRGSGGFVAGFFYSHDLTTSPGSNRAEIFYSLVPDPNALFGDARQTNLLRQVVPPVLAHEYQHMIHFNQRTILRGAPWESLWLSEGLAHLAEDLVGDVFEARGETALADRFKQSNFLRVRDYLLQPAATSLVPTHGSGTLAERGAAWLFLRYLMTHYGGTELITRITQSVQSSAVNVSTQTETPWHLLVAQYGVAMWADDAPELEGTLDPLYRIDGVSVRERLQTFPLVPIPVSFGEFALTGTLQSSAPVHVMLRAPLDNTSPLNLALAGSFGGSFAENTVPGLSILRVR